MDAARQGAQVVVISGNHDNGAMFEALSPLAAAAGVHVLGRPKTPSRRRVAEHPDEQRRARSTRVSPVSFATVRHPGR